MKSAREISESFRTRFRVAALVLLALCAVPAAGQEAQTAGARWVTAWSTSQHAISRANETLTDMTLRILARPTISGDRVRVRLENRLNTEAVTLGDAFVGLVNRGPMDLTAASAGNLNFASLVRGSNRRLTFAGAQSVTIPAGGAVTSDPVALNVRAQQDMAVSLYVPGPNVRMPNHAMALTTSYRAAGNRAAEEEFYLDVAGLGGGRPTFFTQKMNQTPFLTAIDVESQSTGAIVALGDSITDGFCSTVDAHDRFEDVLAMRLRGAAADGNPNAHKAVVNAGINANTITGNGGVLDRLDRDVLGLTGVTDVILFIGTNDIGAGMTSDQVAAGITQIITRVKAKGAKIFGTTLIPRQANTFFGAVGGFDANKMAQRNALNRWIREQAPFDGILDFDSVMKDPMNLDSPRAEFDCDGIHPNIAGYFALGNSIDLKRFRP